MSDNELIQKAIEMRSQALAPYSNYKVGAAVLTESGRIFGGCNIENSSYSLTICAERVALFKAVQKAKQSLKRYLFQQITQACHAVRVDKSSGTSAEIYQY